MAKRFAHLVGQSDTGIDRVTAVYGPNYQRLAEIKKKYDPDNLFHFNQNIRPNHA